MNLEPNTDNEYYMDFLESHLSVARERLLIEMSNYFGVEDLEKLSEDFLEGCVGSDEFSDEKTYKILNKDLGWFKLYFEEKLRNDFCDCHE